MPVTEAPDGMLLRPLPERMRLLNVYAPTVCAPVALKLTVLVDAVKVPAVPLKKSPPALSLPEPENVMREAVPEEVILPEILAVPVEIRIWLNREASVVANNATEAAENVPAPMLIWFTLTPLACSCIREKFSH